MRSLWLGKVLELTFWIEHFLFRELRVWSKQQMACVSRHEECRTHEAMTQVKARKQSGGANPYEIPMNFQRDVAALMAPHGSAIFLLLRAENAPVVLKQLRNYGDTIVHTSVSSEQDNKMLAMLAEFGEPDHQYSTN